MRWAVFTDFHTGRADHQAQHDAFAAALRESAKHAPGGIDVVLLAGDIAQAGTPPQYETFASRFLAPMRATPVFADARVFAVPGNHDVNCDAADPVSWDSLGERRRQLYFEESPTGVGTRQSRAATFSAFDAFVEKEGIVAPLASKEVTRAHSFEVRGERFQVVLTNTAFMCDREKDIPGDGKLPSPTQSLRTVLQRLDNAPQSVRTIVLGHHPIKSFLFAHQEPLKRLIAENHAVYLHGHTHQLEAEVVQSGPGLLSLGFGATYPASLDASPSRYRNSFALFSWEEEILVRVFQWEGENGRWVPTVSAPTPFLAAPEGPPGTFIFHAHESRRARKDRIARPPRPAVARKGPTCESVSMIGGVGPGELLTICRDRGIVSHVPTGADLRTLDQGPGFAHIQYSTDTGSARVRVTTAGGQLLTKDDIERANTQIDYEGLVRQTLITTGTMSPEARSSYLLLKDRKPIVVLDNGELARALFEQLAQPASEMLEKFDSAELLAELLVGRNGLFVLAQDLARTSWFFVIREDGGVEPESSEVVLALRELRPRLRTTNYGQPGTGTPSRLGPAKQPFDRAKYLRRAHEEFNQVRYAALASIGFRFSSITLEELYVRASAVAGDAGDAAIAKAVDETLQGLRLPDELRAQLEAQLRRAFRTGQSQTVAEASRLYQKHRTVLVLGDPGSGKTCFVKSEIISYCRETEQDTWYGYHVPVYVALSELAPLWGAGLSGELAFLTQLSKLCVRRGLEIFPDTLVELAAAGQVAFFFDGLDEITSLDQRARIFVEICSLIERAHATGNRVVITSRPAATRLVELPERLRTVALRGLTEEEMRVLARRVLAARVAEGASAIHLDEALLGPTDIALVETIVSDCSSTPGLRRLAENPLLLTLLIMIYANSGPPAAKRHRVYYQAVQTLATVRSREAGHRVFSEADLRRRLGAIALALFRDKSATVPRWNDAVQAVRRVVAAERGMRLETVSIAEAEEFLQRVGESTGLVIPHRAPDEPDGGALTFMHYSFLEYYAAAGLFFEPDANMVAADLAGSPRWREVVLLYAGVLGDQSDPTPFIASLLERAGPEEPVSLSNLEFAIECALESDVPAETVHIALLGAIEKYGIWAFKRDPELRARFGASLARVYSAAQSDRIVEFLKNGLTSSDSATLAVYVELAAHVFRDVEAIVPDVAKAFDTAIGRVETPVLVALAEALATCSHFRSERAIQQLKSAFAKSNAAQFAALRAAERAPELARRVWPELLEKLRAQAYLAISAANAILRAGWRVDPELGAASELSHALRCIMQFGQEEHVRGIATSVAVSTVTPLLTSSDAGRRSLGICLLPWVRDADKFVYERLMGLIRTADTEHAARALALGALRLSPDAQGIMRIADWDVVYALLESSTRDVRVAAVRAIGRVRPERGSIDVLLKHASRLKERGRSGADSEEYRALVRALGESRPYTRELHDYVERELVERLDPRHSQTEDARRELLEFLQLVLQSDRVASRRLVQRLKNCVAGPRAQQEWKGDIRGASLAALGWVCEPTDESAEFLCSQLSSKATELHAAVAEAVWRFSLRCKRRISYVRAVNARLPGLRDGIIALAKNTSVSQGAQADFSRLRQALDEVTSMLSAYSEYSARSEPQWTGSPVGGASAV